MDIQTDTGIGGLGEAIIAAKLKKQQELMAEREREREYPPLPTVKGFSRRLLNLLVHSPEGLPSSAIIARLGGRTGATYEALHSLTKDDVISKKLKDSSHNVSSREKYIYYLTTTQRERVQDMLIKSGGVTKHYGPNTTSKEDNNSMDNSSYNPELAAAVGLIPTEQVASEPLNKSEVSTAQVAQDGKPDEVPTIHADQSQPGKKHKLRTVRNRGMSKDVLAFMQNQNGAMLPEQVAAAMNVPYPLVRSALDYLSNPDRADLIKKPLPGYTRKYTFEATYKTPQAQALPKQEPITPPSQEVLVPWQPTMTLTTPPETTLAVVPQVEAPAEPAVLVAAAEVIDFDFHIDRALSLTITLNGQTFKLDKEKANELLSHLARFDDVLRA